MNFDSALERIRKAYENSQDIIVAGIAGGSCSGKTTLARDLGKLFDARILKMDDYYKGFHVTEEKFDYNFDEPAAIDMELLVEHLRHLKSGRAIEKPVYDFSTHNRKGYESFAPVKLVVLDGLFALHDVLREHMDVLIYVDCSEENRLERRIKRDMEERGRTRESVIYQFHKTVKPMHELHVESTKKFIITTS